MTFFEQLFEKLGGTYFEISSNLWKSRLRKTAVTWILVGVFEYLPSFFSQILDLICWTVSIFILIWRDTDYQKFKAGQFSPRADGKAIILLSLDHFWKQTNFFSKNNTSKDNVIKKNKYCKCK